MKFKSGKNDSRRSILVTDLTEIYQSHSFTVQSKTFTLCKNVKTELFDSECQCPLYEFRVLIDKVVNAQRILSCQASIGQIVLK